LDTADENHDKNALKQGKICKFVNYIFEYPFLVLLKKFRGVYVVILLPILCELQSKKTKEK